MHGGGYQMAGAGLCLILGGVGAIISYRIKGATEQTAMIGGTGVALALIVFLVHMLTDEEYRLEAVRNYMVDYLEIFISIAMKNIQERSSGRRGKIRRSENSGECQNTKKMQE